MQFPGKLKPIIQRKIERLEEEKQLVPHSVIRALAEDVRPRKSFAFSQALKNSEKEPKIIAEIKRGSPSKGIIRRDLNLEHFVNAYREGGASAISVLTERDFFFAREDDFHKVRNMTSLPLLRKDFIIDEYQIYQSALWNADAILLIVRILSPDQLTDFIHLADELGIDALVEVHRESEMETAIHAGARIIGINNRDLDSFRVSLDTTIRLARYLESQHIGVCESGISSHDDISKIMQTGIKAFLVGEHLVRSEKPAETLRLLRGIENHG